jgi:hypothetical protein
LLSGPGRIELLAFEEAVKRLGPGVDVPPVPAQPATAAGGEGPKRFLQRVMNDAAVPLALRIEAVRALPQQAGDPRLPRGG